MSLYTCTPSTMYMNNGYLCRLCLQLLSVIVQCTSASHILLTSVTKTRFKKESDVGMLLTGIYMVVLGNYMINRNIVIIFSDD